LLIGTEIGQHFGSRPDAVTNAVMWYGTLAPVRRGAVGTWRTFMRLEAIDGPLEDLDLP
jgi:hypothetical protein